MSHKLAKWRELAIARGELIKLMQDEEGQMTLSMLEMRSRIEDLEAEFEELRHKYRIFRLLVLHSEHTIDPAHWRKQEAGLTAVTEQWLVVRMPS